VATFTTEKQVSESLHTFNPSWNVNMTSVVKSQFLLIWL